MYVIYPPWQPFWDCCMISWWVVAVYIEYVIIIIHHYCYYLCILKALKFKTICGKGRWGCKSPVRASLARVPSPHSSSASQWYRSYDNAIYSPLLDPVAGSKWSDPISTLTKISQNPSFRPPRFSCDEKVSNRSTLSTTPTTPTAPTTASGPTLPKSSTTQHPYTPVHPYRMTWRKESECIYIVLPFQVQNCTQKPSTSLFFFSFPSSSFILASSHNSSLSSLSLSLSLSSFSLCLSSVYSVLCTHPIHTTHEKSPLAPQVRRFYFFLFPLFVLHLPQTNPLVPSCLAFFHFLQHTVSGVAPVRLQPGHLTGHKQGKLCKWSLRGKKEKREQKNLIAQRILFFFCVCFLSRRSQLPWGYIILYSLYLSSSTTSTSVSRVRHLLSSPLDYFCLLNFPSVQLPIYS